MRNRARYDVLNERYEVFYKGPKCYYCCLNPADTMDHCPPISIDYSYGAEALHDRGVKLLKVSACRECNSILGDQNLLFLQKRVRYVYDKLLIRYKKQLYAPNWSEREIDLLDYTLACMIKKHCDIKYWIERRLEMMEDIHQDWI